MGDGPCVSGRKISIPTPGPDCRSPQDTKQNHPLFLLTLTSNYHIEHSPTDYQVNLLSKHLPQLVEHLEKCIKPTADSRRSELGQQIYTCISRPVVVTNCRTKCKQLLNTLLAAELSKGFLFDSPEDRSSFASTPLIVAETRLREFELTAPTSWSPAPA